MDLGNTESLINQIDIPDGNRCKELKKAMGEKIKEKALEKSSIWVKRFIWEL
jgi:hypothetical protein